jgi:hypothetical protein
MAWLSPLLCSFGGFFRARASLQIENLALRHQLGVLQRSCRRPRLRPSDRILWSWLSRVWSGGGDEDKGVECMGVNLRPGEKDWRLRPQLSSLPLKDASSLW